MTFPVDIPFDHDDAYGTGQSVRAEYAVGNNGDGKLFVTYVFPLTGVLPQELSSILSVLQQAITRYGVEQGYITTNSGVISMSPGEESPDGDPYEDPDDYDDYGLEDY